jgi:hypothetical protein
MEVDESCPRKLKNAKFVKASRDLFDLKPQPR